MKMVYRNKRFELYPACEEDYEVINAIGGCDGHDPFYTTSPALAYAYLEFCDTSDKLRGALTRTAQRVKQTPCSIDIPVPEGCQLREYQKVGIEWMSKRERCILGDLQGTGKTLEAIGLANLKEYKKILVICPGHLKFNWMRELTKWSTVDRTVGFANSGGEFPDTDVVLISYGMIGMSRAVYEKRRIKKGTKDSLLSKQEADLKYRKLKRKFYKQIIDRQWDLLVCDEAHRIRNKRTIAATSIMAFSNKIRNIIFATGGPVINRPEDLYVMLKIIDQNTWGNYHTFAKRYCDLKISKWGWDTSGASNLYELRQRLKNYMIRRGEEVLTDLPEQRRQTIEISTKGFESVLRKEMGTEQKWLTILDDLEIQIEHYKSSGDRDAYKTALKKLRDNQFLAFTEMAVARKETALAKVPVVAKHIELLLESEEKVVVFGHHREVLLSLKEYLKKYNPALFLGGLTEKKRDKEVYKFTKTKQCRVFIGGITAAGEGLNLIEASTLVFAELAWTSEAMLQACKRIHRLGQTKDVLIQYILLSDSLDAKWMTKSLDAKLTNAITKKQDIIDTLLN